MHLEISKLKELQAKEMSTLKEHQAAAQNSDEDKKNENDRLYQALPRSVAEKFKAGESYAPTDYKNLTFFKADIVQFAALSSSSHAQQIVSLLNRLQTQLDESLESYDDIYKSESIGNWNFYYIFQICCKFITNLYYLQVMLTMLLLVLTAKSVALDKMLLM